MPEVRLDAPQQCLADGSSAEEEAAMSRAPALGPAWVSGERAATAESDPVGSAVLVRRFGEGQGASEGDLPPCLAEQLKAVVACGGALLTVETPPAFYLAALSCMASVIAVDECLSAHSSDHVE